MKKICVILFLFYTCTVTAQFFTQEAEIRSVPASTLYRINIQPALRMHMSSDFRDTRIVDSQGQEIPCIVMNEAPLKSSRDFVPYTIVSQKNTPHYSEVIVENKENDKISNIAFNINNSDARKYCAIEGSNDLKQWYSVSEKQELSLAYSNQYTNTYHCIYFPLNDYKYFRLLIDNFRAEAFKINSAGYFKNSVSPGALVTVPAKTKIMTDGKLKTTSIHVSLNNEQEINRLDFFIGAPRLFKRKARIYVEKERKIKRQTEKYEKTLHNFELSTDRPLLFDLSFRAKEFVIELSNYDNPALRIDSIVIQQLAAYLVCDLEANKKYMLKWGNKRLPAPQYDLGGFVSTIPHLLPEAHIGEVKDISAPALSVAAKEKPFVESRAFLWTCIAAGALIVLLFSLSLIKEMRAKNADGV